MLHGWPFGVLGWLPLAAVTVHPCVWAGRRTCVCSVSTPQLTVQILPPRWSESTHLPRPRPRPHPASCPSTTASTSGREKASVRFPHFGPRPLSTSWERRSEESQPRRNHDTVPLPPPGKIRFLASVYRGPFSANSAGLLRSPGTASPRPPLSGPAVLLPVTLASFFPLRTDTFPLPSTCPQPHLLPLGAQPRETKAGRPRGRPGQPGPLPASSRFPF